MTIDTRAVTPNIHIVTPFEKMPWGYTGIFELENGGGLFGTPFLLFPLGPDLHSYTPAREFQSRAAKAIWDFHGIYASSRHIPGVRFAGVSHPGLIGTAPSAELLATWTARETALVDEHPGAVPAVALLPNAVGAYVGQELAEDAKKKIYAEGARTVPGREHGGNCDVGSTSAAFFVFVGAPPRASNYPRNGGSQGIDLWLR